MSLTSALSILMLLKCIKHKFNIQGNMSLVDVRKFCLHRRIQSIVILRQIFTSHYRRHGTETELHQYRNRNSNRGSTK